MSKLLLFYYNIAFLLFTFVLNLSFWKSLQRIKSHFVSMHPLHFINRLRFPSVEKILRSKLLQKNLPVKYKKNVQILNVQIDNFSMPELLSSLKEGFILTPNVDHLMKLQTDMEFLRIYSLADYKVCDSQILLFASHFLKTPFKQKISGSDLFPAFCEFHKDNQDIQIFLLGGIEGASEKAADRINSKFGRNIIVEAYCPPFFFENNEQECLKIINRINKSKATVLAIGVGAPKQEKWIYKHKNNLPLVKIFMAIGATINFEAGVIKRAPKWVSNCGLEWLYRLACEPRRLWKRYLVNDLPFIWLILKQKLGFYKKPDFPASIKLPYQMNKIQ